MKTLSFVFALVLLSLSFSVFALSYDRNNRTGLVKEIKQMNVHRVKHALSQYEQQYGAYDFQFSRLNHYRRASVFYK